ncbi:MAG: tetratricopeptide repeat protein [Planctomycetota bacterium]
MNWRARVVLALIFVSGSAASAGPVEERFEAANRAYEGGDFAGAEREYRAILEYGLQAPEVYYNLGNAVFRQGRPGQAILNYERALRLAPADEDVLFNLEYSREQLVDREAAARHWIADAYTGWIRLVGFDGDAWLLLWIYLPTMVAVGAWIGVRDERLRRLARFATIVLLVLVVPAGGLLVVRGSIESSDRGAIVMDEKVQGRSGPDEGHPTLFTIHEGLKVQVRKESGEWVQVLLPNGLNGWLPSSSVERI